MIKMDFWVTFVIDILLCITISSNIGIFLNYYIHATDVSFVS